jgi:GalNAc5-diNAcBac-PP-undecaprenol beta-1,3-glucosyltransferase
MMPDATILIPTHDHGPTLRASIASALQQTRPVEVFVIGDGVPNETREIVEEFAQSDGRIRFFDHPKGPRHGEIYRHQALEHARARIVCYLSDDDLYFPHHVEEMSKLLEDADFAHAQAVEVKPDGSTSPWTVNLASQIYQRELLQGRNRIPLSAGAHTLAAYHGLEEGWTTTPSGTPTDLHMWQKFLRHPGNRFVAGEAPSVLVFSASIRQHLTSSERCRELQLWLPRITGDQAIAQFNLHILRQKTREAADLESRVLGAVHNGGVLAPLESMLQVFFPSPEGYNERDSACFPVRFRVWQKILLKVPSVSLGSRIRIDPANCPCLIELSRIQLVDSDGAVVWHQTEGNACSLEVGGSAAAISRGHIVQLVSDGNDPQVLLPPVDVSTPALHLELMVRLDADVGTLNGLFATHLRVMEL